MKPLERCKRCLLPASTQTQRLDLDQTRGLCMPCYYAAPPPPLPASQPDAAALCTPPQSDDAAARAGGAGRF